VRDRRPLYAQVAERIKADFSVSTATDTVRLPGEMALAERYQVSRTTIREAHRLLEQEGAISARHGVGTFITYQPERSTYVFDVLSPVGNVMRSVDGDGDTVLIGCTLLPLSRALRGRFGWPGDTLVRLERMRRRDARTMSYSVDVVPGAYVGGTVDEESIGNSLVRALSDGGFAPHHADSILTAVMAPHRVAKEMGGAASKPVIRSQEVLYDTKGQVLAISLQYLDASALSFKIRRRAT
jgi:GntR family transcriptional regulator